MTDPRAKVTQAVLLTTADETEASFYDAMQHADIDRMMQTWADDEDIACVHPGGPRVVGSVAVRAGFEAVFANGPVHISIEHVRRMETAVRQAGGRMAVTPLVHGYGPLDDFLRRFRLVADSEVDGAWINRYGYLSDAKLDAVGDLWRDGATRSS